MNEEKTDFLIIGGGLTGLTLGYLLRDMNVNFRIVESRNRWGGRILTHRSEGAPPQEMGATWLGKKHTALNTLLGELGIEIFEQNLSSKAVYEAISTSAPQLVQLPPNNDPSYRIAQGTDSVITALLDHIPQGQLHLNEKVTSLSEEGDKIKVTTSRRVLDTDVVISTLPPALFSNAVTMKPSLPSEVLSILDATHTWMCESIKVSLSFSAPFWREEGLSGTIFSNVGPIPEMYDHSNVEDDHYALMGFFNGSYFSISKAERLELILTQLRKYFGNKVDAYTGYEEKVWRNDADTFTAYDAHVFPHQNNGHLLYRAPYWNGKLLLGGSETADMHPGYMDGAVRSANYLATFLKSKFNS